MKRILTVIALAVCLLSAKASAAQATCPTGVVCVAAPVATVMEVNLTAVNNCGSGTCSFQYYRCVGTASSCPTGSAVWQLLNTTALTTLTFSDLNVNSGTTYSYFAVALAGGNTSGPSNVATVVVPSLPTAPTGVTAVGQ